MENCFVVFAVENEVTLRAFKQVKYFIYYLFSRLSIVLYLIINEIRYKI